jgi:hypothetical protein
MSECRCMTPPFHYLDYETVSLGVDMTNNRCGEVTIETCRACGSKWLRYFIEHASFSQSGRWYRGLVTSDILESLTPEQAPELISSLPWYFYGGSYFRTLGRKGSGPLRADLF